MSATLERFALKSRQEGRLGGVGIAVHAIPDAFAVLHGGVGCKYKYSSALHAHDRARPQLPSAYTEITDIDLTGGSGARIGPYLRSWYERRKPAFMVVATVTFLEMTGEDFAAEVEAIARTVPCDVAYVPCLGFEGDLHEGYAAVVLEVARRVPWKKARPRKKQVSVIGHLFDRHELDQQANIDQLRVLVGALGLELGPVLLSGSQYGALLGAGSSGVLVGSPYLGARLDEAADIAGREVAPVGLPLGVAGTLRWLRDVAKAAGLPARAVESIEPGLLDFADRQLAVFRDFVHHVFPRPRSAIFADTPSAAGLATLLAEAELPPVLVGLTDRSLGGREAFLREAARIGVDLPADLEVLEAPSLLAIREKLATLRAGGDLAAVIGSTTELNCLAPDGPRLARIEYGYPSTTYHCITPSPTFGIQGALGLCQRILNQLS